MGWGMDGEGDGEEVGEEIKLLGKRKGTAKCLR